MSPGRDTLARPGLNRGLVLVAATMLASTKAGPFAITRIKTSLLRSTGESALQAALAYGAFQVLYWAICECPKVKYRRSARFRLAVKGMAIFTRA